MQKKLSEFVEKNFDYWALKKAGFWINGEKKKDYEAQAKRICTFFGFKSI